MRILHVIATLDSESGGPATACIEMAQAVAELGHEVDIMTTDWCIGQHPILPHHAEKLDCRILTFPVEFPRPWKRSTQLAKALYEQASTYDLLDIHSLHLFHNMVAPAAARRAGVPYIVRPHGLLDPYIRRRHRIRKFVMEVAFQNRALRDAAAIHYTSSEEMRISQPYACGTPGVIVPLGVELPLLHSSQQKNPRRILFLSRLHAKKGLDLLIPAFMQVRKRYPDSELVIAGPDDGELAPTRDLVAKHGLQGAVSFPGMLRGEKKYQAFAQAGLFVLPSHSENFGIALAEAMAAGLPVVTTDQVNIHDAITEAEAGLVTPCRVQPLADAMQRILSDPALAARLGRNGRELAATRYSWPAIGRQLETLYADLIERHRAH